MIRVNGGTSWVVLVGFFCVLALSSGCATTESLVKKALPESWAEFVLPAPSVHLKRRVLVLPITDQGGFGAEKTERCTMGLIRGLMQCPDLILYETVEGTAWPVSLKSPDYGIVVPHRALEKAQRLNMEALVSGTLNPMDEITETSGIWPFRKLRTTYKISMILNVVDVANGTLLFTKLESVTESISAEDAKDKDEESLRLAMVDLLLPRLLNRVGRAVVEAVLEMPWTGRIRSVTDDGYIINAGSEVGVMVGDRFQVFAEGEAIKAKTGVEYQVMGPKVGEIEVVSVEELEATAVSTDESSFLEGQAIRYDES